MPLQQKILLLCYSFPPAPGTGGRRWVKFAKYLKNYNVDMHVVGSAYSGAEPSSWAKDLKNLHYSYYPIVNNIDVIFTKWIYKIKFFLLRYFTKQNYFDRTYFWTQRAYRQSVQIIKKHNIETLVCTMPPFSNAAIVIQLKKQFPHLYIITDIRDFHKYYYKGLTSQKFDFNFNKLKQALQISDVVLTVSDYMTQFYKQQNNLLENSSTTYYTLHNGYDVDDYHAVNESKAFIQNDKLNLVYMGNLIDECRIYVISLLNACIYIRKNNALLYKKLHIAFYGNVDNEVLKFINTNELDDVVFFKGRVTHQHAMQIIKNASLCLIFPADFYALYSLETKFFEYTLLRKPILTFPSQGKCSQIINTHNLGKAFDTQHSEEAIANFLQKLMNNEYIYNSTYAIEEYSIAHLTTQLIKLLKY